MTSTFSSMALRTLLIATGALALGAHEPLRAQSAACATPYVAMSKLFEKPFHMYMIDSADTDKRLHAGKPRVSEEVFINNVVYVQVNGKWRKSPVDVVEMRKDNAEKLKDDKSTCTHVRDESVNGEGASVWAIHSVTEYGTNDSQAWISKSRNVVLQSETRMDVGGALGKSHMVAKYDYANVHAPAGAQ